MVDESTGAFYARYWMTTDVSVFTLVFNWLGSSRYQVVCVASKGNPCSWCHLELEFTKMATLDSFSYWEALESSLIFWEALE